MKKNPFEKILETGLLRFYKEIIKNPDLVKENGNSDLFIQTGLNVFGFDSNVNNNGEKPKSKKTTQPVTKRIRVINSNDGPLDENRCLAKIKSGKQCINKKDNDDVNDNTNSNQSLCNIHMTNTPYGLLVN